MRLSVVLTSRVTKFPLAERADEFLPLAEREGSYQTIEAEMSDETPDPGQRERRLMLRYPANAPARVVRENDPMRSGTEATIKDISAAGLGIHMDSALTVDEQVKIVLRNDVQRIEKEVRAAVRHVTPREDGGYYIGFELYNRLTPLEVSLLRMGTPDDPQTGGPRWV